MKPTQRPDWQVSGIEPVSTRVSGWMPGDEPQAGEFNWLFNNLSQWVDHIDIDLAKDTPNGIAGLDALGKLDINQIPEALIGALNYQGLWDADTNTPTIVSGIGTKGYYYKVSVSGNTTFGPHSFWNVGDWIIFDGIEWDRLDNYESVFSVAGKVGAVTLVAADVSGVAALDSSPTFTGTVTASGFIGNASSATTFTGSLGGDVTGTQSATSIANTVVTGKTLTGYTSSTGAISASDTILSAIGKLNGNTPSLSAIAPQDVGGAGSAGSATTASKSDHTHRGVSSLSVSGSSAIYGAVTLSAGSGITLSQSPGNIQITSSGGGAVSGVTDLTPAYTYTDVAIATEVSAREAGVVSAKAYADTVSTPKNISLSGTSIDWTAGDVFYQNITTNTTYTFANETNGKTIVLIVKNTAASDVTLTLPTTLKSGVLNLIVAAGKENIYTFVRSNSKTYSSVIADMV